MKNLKMSNSWKMFMAFILTVGAIWGGVHYWGSDDTVEITGTVSIVLFGTILLAYLAKLGYNMTKAKKKK